ncbi:Ig-like domain-containing protein [Roseibium sp.]|uniref:Ig-like domain-containing protein n=1 Tax=Roseibium sp. TaxID=1936156 RepID=UPI003A96D529
MPGKAFGKTKTEGKPQTGSDSGDNLDASANLWNTRINGGDGSDAIVGSAFADRINAGDGDDTISGGAGDDIIFGNDGFDTAVYEGSILDFNWSWAKGNTLVVEDTTRAEGTDQLKHIEALQFSDYTFYLDGRNNAPLVMMDDQTVDEDGTLGFTFDAIDFDGGTISLDSVSVSGGTISAALVDDGIASGRGHRYELTFETGGGYDYLAVGETATEIVSITVGDGQGGTTTLERTITIEGRNDAPTLGAGTLSADEDGSSVMLDLSALADDVDSDDDGSTLVYSISGAPAEGSASISGSTLTFDPGDGFQDLAAGETRDVEIEVTATDAHGAATVNTMTVTVTGADENNTGPTDFQVTSMTGRYQWGFTDWNALYPFGNLNNSTDLDAVTDILTDGYQYAPRGGSDFSLVNGVYNYPGPVNTMTFDLEGDATLVDTFSFISSRSYSSSTVIEIEGLNENGIWESLFTSTTGAIGVTTGNARAYELDVTDMVTDEIRLTITGAQVSLHEVAFNDDLSLLV